ncbi:hypothetical protein HFP57_02135 [Parasphingopyxis algicola]|uniref:hypothetical protein n=1 Tax=Parasphingopyxis algicola TaxID=2026624 RepID=UPI0015A16916|nr:hypothetical protein [Parasphingopyxis algicola]QLC23947.1 hypothetical protein HFP57_02135 [Parasphingopyxis algicola]
MSSPRYLEPDSRMTLREALAELRELEADVSDETIGDDLTKALIAHDVVHILFGCDISDDDEVIAHLWMVVGTDARLGDMRAIARDRDHIGYARSFAHGRRVLLVLRNLPRMLGTVIRARRMTKFWPFGGFEENLDRTLADLRAEYGITVPAPGSRRQGRRGPHHPAYLPATR